MYGIVKGIPVPENLPKKKAGAPKYPFDDMEVDDSFVVPYSDRQEGEDDAAFRSRVQKSCRAFARRDEKTQEGSNEPPVRKDFTVAVMTKDDDQEPKRFVTGDAVVWRVA